MPPKPNKSSKLTEMLSNIMAKLEIMHKDIGEINSKYNNYETTKKKKKIIFITIAKIAKIEIDKSSTPNGMTGKKANMSLNPKSLDFIK